MTAPVTKRTSITDSPWYWVYLFATAGLIALVLMGPKFAHRQAQIESKSQGRQRAAQSVSGIEPAAAPLASAHDTAIKLWPLYLVLSAVVMLAGIGMIRRRHRRPASQPRLP